MGEEGAEGAREQRTWCVSTSEGARLEQVRKLVRDVSAFVDGKAGTKVEVVSGGDVRDVVEALKNVNGPTVTATRRGAEKEKGGLDVEVVVREGPKEAAKFVARVDVVPRRVVCEDDGGEVEIAGRVWKRRNLRATKYKDETEIERAQTGRRVP